MTFPRFILKLENEKKNCLFFWWGYLPFTCSVLLSSFPAISGSTCFFKVMNHISDSKPIWGGKKAKLPVYKESNLVANRNYYSWTFGKYPLKHYSFIQQKYVEANICSVGDIICKSNYILFSERCIDFFFLKLDSYFLIGETNL